MNQTETNKEIASLGRVCASDAKEQATVHGKPATDDEGTPLWSPEPLEGDWDAVERMVGRELTSDEERVFLDAYADNILEV